MMRMKRRQQDQQSRAFSELSALVFDVLRSENPPSQVAPSSRRRSSSSATQLSPSGFASLLLGISLTLMLCGSLAFVIGFLLMPWVVGLAFVFYVVGLVSTISVLGRTILYHTTPAQRKETSLEAYVK